MRSRPLAKRLGSEREDETRGSVSPSLPGSADPGRDARNGLPGVERRLRETRANPCYALRKQDFEREFTTEWSDFR